MAAVSYREGLLEKLAEAEYSSLFIETALEEAIQDGDTQMLLTALRDVVEAAEHKQEFSSETEVSRHRVYRSLLERQGLTVEIAISALSSVGIMPNASVSESQPFYLWITIKITRLASLIMARLQRFSRI